MKLRAVIVEDEPPARRRLMRLLQETGQVDVVGEAETVREAVQRIGDQDPDVVFLDIRIPGGDGFEVLKRLEEIPPVIFVTAYDDFAVKAFEADAVDYLVKPVSPERLKDALDRLHRRVEGARAPEGLGEIVVKSAGMPARIITRRRGRIVLLDPQEVTHLTADHTLVFAWKEGQSFLVPRTLQEMEAQLQPLGFRRCHRSALVNLKHIAAVRPAESGNFVLDLDDPPKTAVPLSRRRARELREEMGF